MHFFIWSTYLLLQNVGANQLAPRQVISSSTTTTATTTTTTTTTAESQTTTQPSTTTSTVSVVTTSPTSQLSSTITTLSTSTLTTSSSLTSSSLSSTTDETCPNCYVANPNVLSPITFLWPSVDFTATSTVQETVVVRIDRTKGVTTTETIRPTTTSSSVDPDYVTDVTAFWRSLLTYSNVVVTNGTPSVIFTALVPTSPNSPPLPVTTTLSSGVDYINVGFVATSTGPTPYGSSLAATAEPTCYSTSLALPFPNYQLPINDSQWTSIVAQDPSLGPCLPPISTSFYPTAPPISKRLALTDQTTITDDNYVAPQNPNQQPPNQQTTPVQQQQTTPPAGNNNGGQPTPQQTPPVVQQPTQPPPQVTQPSNPVGQPGQTGQTGQNGQVTAGAGGQGGQSGQVTAGAGSQSGQVTAGAGGQSGGGVPSPVVISGTTITPGAAPVTINGVPVSLAADGSTLVSGTATIPVAGGSTAAVGAGGTGGVGSIIMSGLGGSASGTVSGVPGVATYTGLAARVTSGMSSVMTALSALAFSLAWFL